MDLIPESIKAEAARLRDAATKFMTTYQRFLAIESQAADDPALAERWQVTKSLADKTRATIEFFVDAFNRIAGWGLAVAGPTTMQGLGVLPLAIPLTVAGVSAAIAAIIYATGQMLEIIGDNDRRQQILAINRQRIENGQAPLSPESLVGTKSNWASEISGSVKWIALGAVALFALNQWQKKR